MSGVEWNWGLDGWIVAAGALCASAAALLGNFLVLRKLSMLGDAITHAILPGLAAAFFLSESRSSFPMFLGAVLAGLLTAVLTQWIRNAGKVDEGASMGVVFTALFAIGLVMIVQAADRVDLDPGCVLYGAIELTPLDVVDVFGLSAPRVVVVLSCVTFVNLAFVVAFYKELKVTAFDPALATTMGINASLLHYLLMILVATTAVASFESVGSILAVAMFIVPPAAAYLLTDRLPVMIAGSVVIGVVSAATGHLGAIVVPSWFGYRSTTTAGMMAVAAGAIFLLALLFSPRHGIVSQGVRRFVLRLQILTDDIVALLYRMEEGGTPEPQSSEKLRRILGVGRWPMSWSLGRLHRSRLLVRTHAAVQLTEAGRARAQELIRSHRLWEQYLVTAAGIAADRIHDKAEQLEHFTDLKLRDRLDDETARPKTDPHGSPIPPEAEQERQ